MTNKELIEVYGGASTTISGNLLSSLAKILTIFLDMGRSVGSAINYALNKRTC